MTEVICTQGRIYSAIRLWFEKQMKTEQFSWKLFDYKLV
jgi:hypothetical protein